MRRCRMFIHHSESRPFFNGEFGLVDIAIAPWVVRDFVLQEHRGFKRGDVSPVWESRRGIRW